MTRREVAQPPTLPGFDYIELIGSGVADGESIDPLETSQFATHVEITRVGGVTQGVDFERAADEWLMNGTTVEPTQIVSALETAIQAAFKDPADRSPRAER